MLTINRAFRHQTGFLLRCAAISALILNYSPCRAQQSNWDITLDSPDQSGYSGNMLVYTGTLSNNTGTDLLLLGLDLNPPDGYSDSNFSVHFTDDFNNALAANLYTIPTAGYQGSLFEVDILPTATIGTILYGTFDLSVDSPGMPVTITALFSASVVAAPTAVPEPGTYALFGSLGLTGAVLLRRRRAR